MKPVFVGPPEFLQQEVRSIRVRCQASAAVSAAAVTMANLGALIGLVSLATGAGSATVLLSQSAKLKRVCVWGQVATAGTPVTCQLRYVDDPANTDANGPPKTVSDTSVSYDRPAYVCLEPSKMQQSFFSQWFTTNVAQTYLNLTCPAGGIIDFWFNFVLCDQGAPLAGPAIAGASTLGTIYHKSFTTGGANIVPVGPLNSAL